MEIWLKYKVGVIIKYKVEVNNKIFEILLKYSVKSSLLSFPKVTRFGQDHSDALAANHVNHITTWRSLLVQNPTRILCNYQLRRSYFIAETATGSGFENLIYSIGHASAQYLN